MNPKDQLPSLEALEERIRKVQDKTAPAQNESAGSGIGMQVGVELSSGVLVGTFLGIMLDRWMGTSPWMLLVCFSLGVAGSGLTLYRLVIKSSASASDNETKS